MTRQQPGTALKNITPRCRKHCMKNNKCTIRSDLGGIPVLRLHSTRMSNICAQFEYLNRIHQCQQFEYLNRVHQCQLIFSAFFRALVDFISLLDL